MLYLVAAKRRLTEYEAPDVVGENCPSVRFAGTENQRATSGLSVRQASQGNDTGKSNFALIFGVLALFALYYGFPEHVLFYSFLGLSLLQLWSTAHVQEILYRTGSIGSEEKLVLMILWMQTTQGKEGLRMQLRTWDSGLRTEPNPQLRTPISPFPDLRSPSFQSPVTKHGQSPSPATPFGGLG